MEHITKVPAQAGVLRKQNKKYYGSEKFFGVTDEVLISKALNGCNESFEELLKRNENLFYKTCQKYLPALESVGFNRNDILEDKLYIIYEAARKYDSSKKASFNTWLGNFTRFYCLNKLNEKKYIKSVINSDSAKEEIDSQSFSKFSSENNNISLNKIFSTLEDKKLIKVKKVFELRYNPEKNKKTTWEEIAEKMDISVESVVNLHKKGLKMLQKEIKYNDLDIFSKNI